MFKINFIDFSQNSTRVPTATTSEEKIENENVVTGAFRKYLF